MTTSYPNMENEPPPIGVDELEARSQGIVDQTLVKTRKQSVIGLRYDLTANKNDSI